MTCVNVANLTDEGLVKPAKECAIVIFGAAGDDQAIDTLYNLARSNLLPKDFLSLAWLMRRW